jgi:hypothetical protein
MSKRLQVILQDPEYREIQRMARSRGMSIAEWVRQALHFARRREPAGSVNKKLEAIRKAVRHNYPTSRWSIRARRNTPRNHGATPDRTNPDF